MILHALGGGQHAPQGGAQGHAAGQGREAEGEAAGADPAGQRVLRGDAERREAAAASRARRGRWPPDARAEDRRGGVRDQGGADRDAAQGEHAVVAEVRAQARQQRRPWRRRRRRCPRTAGRGRPSRCPGPARRTPAAATAARSSRGRRRTSAAARPAACARTGRTGRRRGWPRRSAPAGPRPRPGPAASATARRRCPRTRRRSGANTSQTPTAAMSDTADGRADGPAEVDVGAAERERLLQLTGRHQLRLDGLVRRPVERRADARGRR